MTTPSSPSLHSSLSHDIIIIVNIISVKAWAVLSDPKRADDPEAMRALLEKIGLFDASDLKYCSEENLPKLAVLLKDSQRNRFEQIMRL